VEPQNGRPTERKTVVRIETEGDIVK